jgi:hypothetical protein
MKFLTFMMAALAVQVIHATDEFAVPRAEFAKYYRQIVGKEAPDGLVAFAIDPKVSKTGKDAYTIVSGTGVKITGSNMRSVMYGLYDLLERRGGCHWFWDGDVVPKKKSIDLSGLNVYEEAQFEYRGIRYFAHRGLTRFQAEHWGPEDWKQEIDWCLKRRLNVFMLRIGQDDLFQRTFPDTCAYPDPSKPLPGAGTGYNDRSMFWSLKFRGDMRKNLQQYAFARGLMVPEDFGTMTHWYSRTPEDYLDKKNPPFLPQATKSYGERNGLVWDIRDDKWVDEYWKLTKTAVDEYGQGASQQLLHTIGLGERRCYTNRQDNFNLKIAALDKFLSRAHRDYPDAKVLLAGWDFYSTWRPEEVKNLLPRLDPKRDIIWDYEGDATKENNFTQWGLIGQFPYTFSIFLAYEDALDIRANYPLIEERQKLAQNDPACVGYILWPESSHTDTLGLRYFTANAWSKTAVPAEKVLAEFCASRYGNKKIRMKAVWDKVLPASMSMGWRGNYGKLITQIKTINLCRPEKELMSDWKEKVESVQDAFTALAAIPWEGEFIKRDTIDLARTALDRVIQLRLSELSRDIVAWRGQGARPACPPPAGSVLVERAKDLSHLFDLMADVLALHTDYSMWESYQRLDAIEKIRYPGFSKTLFDNASCTYCRSHQYELARHWYAPRMRRAAERLAKAVAENDRKVVLCDDPETERLALMERPLESLRPVLPRTAAQYRTTMLAIAAALENAAGPVAPGTNLLKNPAFASTDGLVPDKWSAGRGANFKGAYTMTGGVLRISECAPAYCHSVSQRFAIDGTKSHWFEADLKCDVMSYKANVTYSLFDKDGKPVVSHKPLLFPFYSGPQREWFRVGLPIPAVETDRVRSMSLAFVVYNNSRKPAEDRAFYIRNPSVTEFCGQTYRPLPPPGSRAGTTVPMRPFDLPCGDTSYQFEKGGVGYLSLRSPMFPRNVPATLTVEAPEGVDYAISVRIPSIGDTGTSFPQKSPDGTYALPKDVRWASGGNVLIFTAADSVPDKFNFRITVSAKGETRVMDVPVETLSAPPPGSLPKTRRYRAWSDLPLGLFGDAGRTNAFAKALADYWRRSGWEDSGSTTVNVTGVFPYRHSAANPLARQGVAMHGTPTGIPCDSDLQAKGAAYYRDRIVKAKLADRLVAADSAVWDYEPYVVGPVTSGCFCEDCRRAFAKEKGLQQTPSADEILKSYSTDWVHFRCRQRAASVKMAVEGIKMVAPKIKFRLCSMPMAPGPGDAGFADDFAYLKRFGIDSPLYEDFTDIYCSMNYTPFLTYFRSLEREMNCLRKPKETLLENGWGVPRTGKLVGLQLAAAFFAGMEHPYIASGMNVADGAQIAEARRAMQFVAETEGEWENAAWRREKSPYKILSGPENRFWRMERLAADGTLFVLAFNCSADERIDVSIEPPGVGPQRLDLPPYSYRLLKFARK